MWHRVFIRSSTRRCGCTSNPVTERTDLSSIADSDDEDHVEYMLDRWKESVEDTLPFFEHMVRYRNTVIYAELLLSRRDWESLAWVRLGRK